MGKVGYASGRLMDEGRQDWSGQGPRPLAWTAWYPAAQASAEEAMFGGPPGKPIFELGMLAAGAALAAERPQFPVVLLSHGSGGTAASLGWLARALAANGFVVLGVDHHGNTAREPYLAEGFLCWWERSRDLSILLDRLSGRGMFASRLDEGRVFAAGFSLGGHTALSLLGAEVDMQAFRAWAEGRAAGRGPREFPDLADRLPRLLSDSAVFRASWERHGASYRDSRARAALLCAPAPTVRGFTGASLAAVGTPVGILVGDADREAPPEGACWLRDRLPDCELRLLDGGVGHFVFLCEATATGREAMPELCIDAPGVDRAAVHKETIRRALDLFGR